jgi:hypothetical protein
MKSIEEVIASIRASGVTLNVKDDEIVSSRPLLPDEKMALKEHHAAAVAIINATSAAPETVEQAYQRGLEEGRKELEGARSESYALGIQHATEEFQTRPPVAAPLAPTHVTTVNEAMEGFTKWLGYKGEYYQWEEECLSALREALVEGDKVHGLFAYTCIIEHADGARVEFQRRPHPAKKKAV